MLSSWTRPESRLCSNWASSSCSRLSSTLVRLTSSSWLRRSVSWERIWLCRDEIWRVKAGRKSYSNVSQSNSCTSLLYIRRRFHFVTDQISNIALCHTRITTACQLPCHRNKLWNTTVFLVLTNWVSSWHFCLTSLSIPSSLERCWSISSSRSCATCFCDSRSCRLLLSLSNPSCMSWEPTKHTHIHTHSGGCMVELLTILIQLLPILSKLV